VIMGENRTFDHVFATYQPPRGEHVDNLLSKGIINIDGTPGPNYGKAAQFSAIDSTFYSINPDHKAPYDHTNKPQPAGTSYAFQACYSDYKKAALDGPGRGARPACRRAPRTRASRTTTICRMAPIRW
jgi:phospholipase C